MCAFTEVKAVFAEFFIFPAKCSQGAVHLSAIIWPDYNMGSAFRYAAAAPNISNPPLDCVWQMY